MLGLRMISLIDKVCRVVGLVAGITVVALALFNCYAVLMRYLFNLPPHWALDLSEFVLVGAVFLGGAYALQVEAHANIPMFLERFSPRTQLVFRTTARVLACALALILIWKGWELALDNLHARTSSFSRLHLFPSYVVVPFGGFLLLLQAVSKIARDLMEYKSTSSDPRR
jgi:TRAP-type C4-dicarboxylate transport system permease small subunit